MRARDDGRALRFAVLTGSDTDKLYGWRFAVAAECHPLPLQAAARHLNTAGGRAAQVGAECAMADQALDALDGPAPEVRERLHAITLEAAQLAARAFSLLDEALDLLEPGEPADQIEGVA